MDLGILPYEISNFAITGEACRHNLNYWTGGNYIGLGPSAASHVAGWRWKNRPHLGEWESEVETGGVPAIDIEQLSPRQRAGEMAMLMLRLQRGLDLNHCSQLTGVDTAKLFAPVIDRLAELHLVEITDDHVRLTRAGIDVADAVAGEFV
jgi:oxygen-independent coproporphyrinogen-3 oxidase